MYPNSTFGRTFGFTADSTCSTFPEQLFVLPHLDVFSRGPTVAFEDTLTIGLFPTADKAGVAKLAATIASPGQLTVALRRTSDGVTEITPFSEIVFVLASISDK